MSMRHEGWLHRLEARVEELEEKIKELEKAELSDERYSSNENKEKRGPGRPRKAVNA